MTDLWRLSAAGLAAGYAAGEFSPVEVVDTCLSRIDGLNPALNAVIALDGTARARAAESAARHAAGKSLGPLDGVPFTVKDNLLAAGLPARWGSHAYDGFIPDGDELPVARLRAAGAIVVGKTNVPEFTLEGYTNNLLFGATGNPWNPALTPGGSSGGAVASAAAGMVPFAIGTDGGGSIRRPAGFAGLIGVKPTIGRLARHGGFPQVLLDMEVVGPLTRSVADAAIAFEAMEGPDVTDSLSHLPPEPDRVVSLDTPPAPLKIVYVERFGDSPVAPVILESVSRVAETLAGLGHHVERVSMPLDIEALNAFWPRIGQIGLAWLRSTMGAAFERASPKFRQLADDGAAVPPGEFFGCLDRIRALRAEAAALFQSVDIVLTPSSAAQPWPATEPFPPVIDGRPVGPRGHALFTGWVNAIGHPAVNIPGPPAPDGMPIGAHLVAGWNRDWLLLRLARQVEQAMPWKDRWPVLANPS
jgi:aspartyl-tRNA(Asn)/glutamyl-tRNA(Gln) amidotransferase subunit A